MSQASGINRRQFLAGGAAALLMMAGAEELRADPPADNTPAGPPINFAVIGLGPRGRDILSVLAKTPGAVITAICDSFEPIQQRALKIAPTAQAFKDYKQVLDLKNVDAVFVATPTYLHRQPALDAIAACKHVYCEAPLAGSLEDGKAIAQAGKASNKVFQVGLQQRTNPQVLHVRKFVETGALKQLAQVRSQWHKKTTWRTPWPDADREKDLNWRLSRATSLGLPGEIGIHHLDLASWMAKELPLSVVGYGGIRAYPDGRDVYDTVQCIVEYPANLQSLFEATLASSYDSSSDVLMGVAATVLLKENRAWMFKEADSDLLGWEVYARKEKVGDDNGIALVADATKQLALGKKPGEEPPPSPEMAQMDELTAAVQDFLQNIRDNKKPAVGPAEGYQSLVTVVKANDAINSGTKIVFQKEWFDLGG